MKVNISGTIAKDKRPDSGLDDIGDKLNANRLQRFAVVGIVEYHGHHEVVGQPESLTIRFAAIEPLDGKDDVTARHLIDKARRARGLGATELTLFDDPDADAGDSPKGPWPGDVDFIAPGATGEQDDTDTAKTDDATAARNAPMGSRKRARKSTAPKAVEPQ